jgi:hypothetical protein
LSGVFLEAGEGEAVNGKQYLCHYFGDASAGVYPEAEIIAHVMDDRRHTAKLRAFLATAEIGDYAEIGCLTIVRIRDSLRAKK